MEETETKTEDIVQQTQDFTKEINSAMKDLKKKFGGESARVLSDATDECPRYPIDSLKLQRVMGGGLPMGRIVELFGWEASGKTSLATYFVAQVNKAGKVVLYIDTENSYNPEYAKIIGVDDNLVILAQPECGEDALQMADWAVDNIPNLGMIVLDSIASLTPRAELDGNYGDAHMGLQARMLSQAMRMMTSKLKKNNVTLLCINQLRMKLGVMYGNPETTTGGKALPFYATLRMKVNRTESEDIIEDDDVVGINIKVRAVKNKIAPPKRNCSLKYSFYEGFKTDEEFIDLAVSLGFIKKWGQKYTILATESSEEVKIEGLENILAYYAENRNAKRNMVKRIKQNMNIKLDEDKEDIGSDEHEDD